MRDKVVTNPRLHSAFTPTDRLKQYTSFQLASFSQNGHSTAALHEEAIPSLWRYAQFGNLCQIKAAWLHILLVSITDIVLPFCHSRRESWDF